MFSRAVLDIDLAKTALDIEQAIRRQVSELRRRGVVVGLSGGIDSSVVTTLSARAVGPDRVQVLLMPERASWVFIAATAIAALPVARRARL